MCCCYWDVPRQAAHPEGCKLGGAGGGEAGRACTRQPTHRAAPAAWLGARGKMRGCCASVVVADERMFSPKAWVCIPWITCMRRKSCGTSWFYEVVYSVTFTSWLDGTGSSGIWLWGESWRHLCRTAWVHLLSLLHLFNISTDFKQLYNCA